MVKSKNIYSDFTLSQVEDIDKLIALIKSEGNFRLKDYKRLISYAKKSSQPARLLKRLRTRISPLITTPIKEDDEKGKGDKSTISNTENSNTKELWQKVYKASDFKIEDGKITIGNYFLQSVRISETHPSWLTDIDHDFHIAPEYRNNNRNEFHFVPYTDLSFLLTEIQKQVDEQEKQRLLKKLNKEWDKLLHYYLNIKARSENNNRDYNRVYQNIFANTYNMDESILYDIFQSKEKWPYNTGICVALSDIHVTDGEIVVSLENVDYPLEYIHGDIERFMQTPSWLGFKKLLETRYRQSFLDEYSMHFEEKFLNDIENIKRGIRNFGKVVFKTYISKSSFNSIFKDEQFLMYLNEDLEPKWAIGDFLSSNYSKNALLLISEEYVFSQSAVKRISSIIDQNWDILERHSEWLLSNLLHKNGSHWELGCTSYIIRMSPRHLRLVTKYYESRHKIPYSNKYSCEEYTITLFVENATHYSDIYWNKCPETFMTYMIWSKNKSASTITLIPTNVKYARYVFSIDTSTCSIEEAAYVIWRFFSSNCANKREGFAVFDCFKVFGIYSVCKY